MKGYFDCIMVDPPFLSEECLSKVNEQILLLKLIKFLDFTNYSIFIKIKGNINFFSYWYYFLLS